MTELIYLKDSYAKECGARVVSVSEGKYVVLDKTIFYPRGGGQPHDIGKIIRKSDGKVFNVVFVGKFNGEVSHEVDGEGLNPGDEVHCVLDWNRRYKLMRMHTAAHVLASILFKNHNALITGNQLGTDKSRIDFSVESFDKDLFINAVERANEILSKNIELKIYELPREEALKIDGLVKLASALPPNIDMLRIVEIPSVDIQADGGTHVNRLSEVGRIVPIKFENKGKKNKRIYYTVE